MIQRIGLSRPRALATSLAGLLTYGLSVLTPSQPLIYQDISGICQTLASYSCGCSA